ncbi:MAG: UDP-4-amino-4,6-dideoxy-N-acetyl-beta-L-altrosamine transaminase [Lachnospiraceae bacterium]|nr:UDP-4-amino-4,6-dideoxy-N-acetyl-beta-L-altrosamine transaminase [Lachnospiraceae bacterium]
MYIPYGTQSISEEDIQAVVKVLHSDYLTTGPLVKEFEEKVAAYTGAKYAVAVSSGTAALHAACFAAGINEGDEVITSPFTFAASANCVLYCGARVVFADIDRRTYNISPKEIEKKITPRTKAVIPVHYAGQPCDIDAVYDIAEKHNLVVIHDAAHALGADYKGKRIGNMPGMTVLSFHPVKHITTGEGGMVLTDNEKYYQQLMLFRSHGITRDSSLLHRDEGGWYYEQQTLGYNYRITDIQCALGISQMDQLDSFIAKRRLLAGRYDEAFKDIKGIITPYQAEWCNNSWHLYTIQVEKRREVFDRLWEAGIGVNVHYIPVYMHPYYRNNGYRDVKCRNTEEVYSNIISLPLYPGLTEQHQDYVIEKVIETVNGV